MAADDDNDAQTWKQKLYLLQQSAPQPYPVYCGACEPGERNSPYRPETSAPTHSQVCDTCIANKHGNLRDTSAILAYGGVYHGSLTREEGCAMLRGSPSGAYLIRDSSSGTRVMTLVINFDEEIKNFRLFLDHNTMEYYVGENRFERIHDLVADGLIHFYVESRGADVIAKLGNPSIYEQSPYVQERERYYTLKYRQREAIGSAGGGGYRPILPIINDAKQVPQSRLIQPTSRKTQDESSHMDVSPRPNLPGRAKVASLQHHMSMIEKQTPKPRPPLPTKSEEGDNGGFDEESIASSTISRLVSKSLSVHAHSNLEDTRSIKSQFRSPLHPAGDNLDAADRSSITEREDKSQVPNTAWSGKAHQFKQLTFAGAQWCDVCTHFMWGLVRQGVRCQDCGMQAHKKCGENTPNDCIPDMKLMKRVFAVELTSLVLMERSQVPQVLTRLIAEIETRGGLKQPGLYRECGFTEHVENMQGILNKDVISADLSRYDDINVFTSLVKKFFKLLPIPLIPFDTYAPLLAAMERSDSSDKLQTIRSLVVAMPSAHYMTMKYFMKHLQRVVDNCTYNLMTADNLGLIFSQSILRMPEINALHSLGSNASVVTMSSISDVMQRVQRENVTMKYLIENQSELLQ